MKWSLSVDFDCVGFGLIWGCVKGGAGAQLQGLASESQGSAILETC